MPRRTREYSALERAQRRARRLLRRSTSSLRVFPDFLIVGAQKCGTTSLHAYLEEHPQLVAPPGRKELHFFDIHHGAGPGYYRSFFPTNLCRWLKSKSAGAQTLCFESTPEYMVFSEARERMHALLGPVPLVVLLRDPIERFWSWYRMYSSLDREVPFETLLDADASLAAHEGRELDPSLSELTQETEALRPLVRGRYVEQLQALFELWPRDAVLVLDFGDLAHDPQGTTGRVLERLGLAPLERESWPVFNANKKSPLPDALRDRLGSYYAGPDAALAELLGWTPGWMQSP
ncbi:MAG: sulfotransferase domain-containing protein [Planctomycetes bacterium]|nr:sulfotransferase domain-containing protein [Planctomycetota bacterium]